MASPELRRSINEFGIDFLKQVASSTENVFFSSPSLSTAFAILLAGAGGRTAEELKQCFKIGHLSDIHEDFGSLVNFLKPSELEAGSTNELQMATKMAVTDDMPILEQFRDVIENKYKANVDSEVFCGDDVKATAAINTWVSNQTQGRIEKMLDEPIDDEASIILLNAIYFKGAWASEFDVDDTLEEPFFGVEENDVDFMFQRTELRIYSDAAKQVTVLEIPYVYNVSMIIFLPDENTGLDSLLSSSSFEDLESLVENVMQASKEDVYLSMPKFKLETSYELKPILSKMGVNRVFDEIQANLSGIIGESFLFVNRVLHKAILDVDEEGTEADVVSVIEMVDMATFEPEPETYRINRPFLFFIRDTVFSVNLFAGTISKL
ncbi:Leukocyte elastase inhibitor [Halotydeus destructor]|nr:Leukocyte elastase inhibitor [Halotydeus destructor]